MSTPFKVVISDFIQDDLKPEQDVLEDLAPGLGTRV